MSREWVEWDLDLNVPMAESPKFLDVVVIARCCRDWPVYPFSPMGRCGYCGERPERTDKTVAAYMAERSARLDADLAALLPIHRTAATFGMTCSTCDGGGCLDCTDPA